MNGDSGGHRDKACCVDIMKKREPAYAHQPD